MTRDPAHPTSSSPAFDWAGVSDLQQLVNDAEEGKTVDPETILTYLGMLEPNLNRCLVPWQWVQPGEGTPLRLCVFRTPSGYELYAMVDDRGWLTVGLARQIGQCVRRRLDGFDRKCDELVSLVATRAQRLVGSGVDLWVTVRRWQGELQLPIRLAYHAVVWVVKRPADDEYDQAPKVYPEVRAAQDEPDDDARKNNSLVAADDIEGKVWFPDRNIQTDPLADLDPVQAAEIESLLQSIGPVPVDSPVAWTSGAVGCGHGSEQVVVARSSGKDTLALPPGDRVRALSLIRQWSHSAGAGQILHMLVGCEDRRILAYRLESTPGQTVLTWQDTLNEAPRGVAFVTVKARKEKAILIAFRTGGLGLYLPAGDHVLRELWQRAWQAWEQQSIAYDTLEKKLAWGQVQLAAGATPVAIRRAILLRLIELLLRQVEQTPDSSDKVFYDGCALFEQAQTGAIGEPVVSLLLAGLKTWASGLDQETDTALPRHTVEPRWLTAIHGRYAPRWLQDQIDLTVRKLASQLKRPKDSVWQQLLKQSRTHLGDHWNQRATLLPEQRCALALERWSNAFLLDDACPTGSTNRQLQGDLVCLQAHGRSWLVMPEPRGLLLLPLMDDGKIHGQEILKFPLDDELIRMAALPGGERLLVATRTGLRELRLSSTGDLSEDWRWSHGWGRIQALAVLAQDGETSVLALAVEHARNTELLLTHLQGNDPPLPVGTQHRHDLEQALTTALDLAWAADGSLLVGVGGGSTARARLFQFDAELKLQTEPVLRSLESRVTAVRFDRKQDPHYALLGECNGLLWCIDIKETRPEQRLRWLYYMDASVVDVLPLAIDRVMHFVCGFDDGQLLLLRAMDGRRIWKDRSPAPIRSLTLASVGHDLVCLAVQTTTGDLALYRLLRGAGRQEAWTAAAQALAVLEQEAWIDKQTRPVRSDLQAVWALAKARRSVPIDNAFYAQLTRREARTRLVRYLAENPEHRLPLQHGAFHTATVRVLSDRDLALLLSYLPGDDSPWDDAIAAELQNRHPSAESGDWSVHARMHLQVVRLQRLGRSQPSPSPKQLMLHRPTDDDFQQRWVRLSFTVLLLRSMMEHAAKEDFLNTFADCLAELPPALILTAGQAAGEVHPHFSILDALGRLLRAALAGEERVRAEDLVELGQALSRAPTESPLALVASVVKLHRLTLGDAETWRSPGNQARLAMLQAVRELQKSLAYPARGVLRRLRQELAKYFPPNRTVPADQEELRKRMDWLAAARRRLVRPRKGKAPLPVLHPGQPVTWDDLLGPLLEETIERLNTIIDLEMHHCNLLTRPFVRLERAERNGNQVTFHLQLVPEGELHLEGVELVLSLESSEGLSKPGTVDARLSFAGYDGNSRSEKLILSGFLKHPDQRSVKLVVRTLASYYAQQEVWLLPVPALPPPDVTEVPFPKKLPETFRNLCHALFASRGGVAVAVMDRELGREQLFWAATESYRGYLLDLDAELRRGGVRGMLRALDEAAILAALTRDAYPAGEIIELLVTAPDELFARLLGGEQHDILDRLFRTLSQRQRMSMSPRIVLVLSSAMAAQLHRWLVASELPLLQVHQPLRGELPGETVEFKELLAWFSERTEMGERAASLLLEDLGYDLRLAIRWIKRQPRRRTADHETALSLVEFLTFSPNECVQLLRKDVRFLEPLDVMHLLAGAMSQVQLERRQLRPGHVPVEDSRSHPLKSKADKVIQRAGYAFDQRALDELASDPQAPAHLQIQGFGSGSSTSSPDSKAFGLVSHLKDQMQRQASLERLVQLGLGSFIHGVFRTASPYRVLIRTLYQEALAQPGHLSDTVDDQVLRRLLGTERPLLQCFTLAELARLPEDLMKSLLVHRGEAERRLLRRLAELWSPGVTIQEGRLRAIWTELFTPEPVTLLDLPGERQDAPLIRTLPAGTRLYGIAPAHSKGFHDQYLLWLDHELEPILSLLHQALDEIANALRNEQVEFRPRVLVTGPGAETLPEDTERRISVLYGRDLVAAAAASSGLGPELVRRARAKLRLGTFSPYRSAGALPPGSPLFVGRNRELEFIQRRLSKHSILVLGGRRIGKTSLLNQIRHWAQKQPELAVAYIDCAGTSHAALRHKLSTELNLPAEDPVVMLRTWGMAQEEKHRTAVLLLNEIDQLLRESPYFFDQLRALNDEGLVRSAMVGYASVVHQMLRPETPFFHWCQGIHYNHRAIHLAELTEPPARRLIDLLEQAPLDLRWRSLEEMDEGYRLLLGASYRIPWMLQRLCHLLVETLEQARRDEIQIDDVYKTILQLKDTFWQEIEGIDYAAVVPGHERASPRDKRAFRLGIQLVLYSLARRRYFLDGIQSPIHNQNLSNRPALDLGFTIGEAREIVLDTIVRLPLGRERVVVRQWFEKLDLPSIFRSLTLTIVLEADPDEGDRFAFLLHIMPRELQRRLGEHDPTLDDTIVKKAVEFMSELTGGSPDER